MVICIVREENGTLHCQGEEWCLAFLGRRITFVSTVECLGFSTHIYGHVVAT